MSDLQTLSGIVRRETGMFGPNEHPMPVSVTEERTDDISVWAVCLSYRRGPIEITGEGEHTDLGKAVASALRSLRTGVTVALRSNTNSGRINHVIRDPNPDNKPAWERELPRNIDYLTKGEVHTRQHLGTDFDGISNISVASLLDLNNGD